MTVPNANLFPQDVCHHGAGFECSSLGGLAFLINRAPENRVIFLHYHALCRRYCRCLPEPGHSTTDSDSPDDSETETDSETEGLLENGDVDGDHEEDEYGTPAVGFRTSPAGHQSASGDVRNMKHTCSGTCTQVARSCSWAYTGECMCTAASSPDLWGLFASRGCATVVSSRLGGRDIAGSNGSWSIEGANLSTVTHANSIAKTLNGYYNVTTGLQVACPCNTTCVSYGCCGSNGTTFAPQDRCLGKLDVTNA